ncbi:hypothetical protein BJY52DRAFT_529782 [Lactarius psammicola]|nr:hypothetical protein BJY52DRAFT_529782 [Lactarius psammicola]
MAAGDMTIRCNSNCPSVRSTSEMLPAGLLARTFRLLPKRPAGVASSIADCTRCNSVSPLRLMWCHQLTHRVGQRSRTHSSNIPSPGRVLHQPRLRLSHVSSRPMAQHRAEPIIRCSPRWQAGTVSCFRLHSSLQSLLLEASRDSLSLGSASPSGGPSPAFSCHFHGRIGGVSFTSVKSRRVPPVHFVLLSVPSVTPTNACKFVRGARRLQVDGVGPLPPGPPRIRPPTDSLHRPPADNAVRKTSPVTILHVP